MSADPKAVNAQLICSGGHFAGSRFELGDDTTLGIDAAGKLAVGPSAKAPSRPMARIFLVNGTMRLEPLSASSGITLDGAPISSASSLDRRHIVGVNGVGEFVYTRAAANRTPPSLQPTPEQLPPPPPLPPAPVPPVPPSSPSPAARPIGKPVFDDVRSTRLEKDGFGAVPELKKRTPPPAPPAKAAGTMVGDAMFDPLPNLAKRQAPEPTPPPTSAPPPPPPPPPAAAGPVPAVPPTQPDEDRTNVFVPPTLYELHVNIPDVGPTIFPLKLGENVVGRGQDADIRIPDPKKWLSRKHVVVKVSVDRVELVDLAGTNGTFVNGQRITSVAIAPGTQFDLGPSLAITLRKK